MNDILPVKLTPAAADDLRTIHAYIAAQASHADADRMLDTLVERLSSLDRFSRRGSLPKELEKLGSDEFLQLVVGKYRIFYRIADARILVVLIVDGRRDMETVLRQRLLAAP